MEETTDSCFQNLLNPTSTLPWFDPPCRDPFFHIAAPLFLWATCFALCLVWLFFVLKLLIEAQPIIWKFRGLRKKIAAIPPKDRPLDGAGLDQLRELLGRDQGLNSSWQEFEETLLIVDSPDGRPEVFNTRQAEELFSEDSLVSARVNLRFYASFPGLLTSAGLLLTFLAILIGLSHIQPDAQGKLTGVEQLVYSLSGKFISSICALVLAMMFTIAEKRVSKSLHRSYQYFIQTINRRFSRLHAERLLNDIRKDISEQSIVFRGFGTSLSGQLKEGFREGMDPLIQRVATALDELTKQKTEGVSDLTQTLSGIVNTFKSSLSNSTESEFKNLSDTLARTAQVLDQSNQQGQKTQEKMLEVITNFDALISKQSSTGQEQISRLANNMEIVLEKLKEVTLSSSDSMGNAIGGLLQRLEQTTSSQFAEMSRRSEALTEMFHGVVQQLQESMQKSSHSVESTVSGILQKSSDWTDNSANRLTTLIEEQNKNASAIGDARNALSDALTVFRTAVREGSDTLKNLDTGSRAMSDGIGSLNNSMTTVSRTQNSLNDLATLIDRNAQNLSQVVDRQAQVLSNYEKVFSELDKGIGGLLAQLGRSMESYSALMKSSMEKTLGQFDNVLGDATAQLKTTVEELSGSLEELVELATKSRTTQI